MSLQGHSANQATKDVLSSGAADSKALAAITEQWCADIPPGTAAPLKVHYTERPGAAHGRRFYPDVSGWAASHNPYVWSEYIDPSAGVMRLVFGAASKLHARDDYPRLVALNAPNRRPEAYFEEICTHSQRRADFTDVKTGAPETGYVLDLLQERDTHVVELLTSTGDAYHPVTGEPIRALTCEGLLRDTPLVGFTREILRRLADAAGRPVELHFALQLGDRDGAILWTPRELRPAETPPEPHPVQGRILLTSSGFTLGRSRLARFERAVYISPAQYSPLSLSNRYELARLLGRLRRAFGDSPWILIGPGRWGTSSPELGIPVRFAEINGAGILIELAEMHDTLTPEVALGTHFLNDIVSHDILCAAILSGREGHRADGTYFEEMPNELARIMPGMESWASVVRVVEARACGGEAFVVWADAVQRRMICAIEFGRGRG